MTQKKTVESIREINGLGAYVQQRREELDLSQRELAERAKISHTFVSRLERGQRKEASQPILRKLADALEVDMEELYAAIVYGAPQELPGFEAYLRAKYEMDENQVQDLSKVVGYYITTHGIQERTAQQHLSDDK